MVADIVLLYHTLSAVGIPDLGNFLYRQGKNGHAEIGESEVNTVQNQYNEQKKSRSQNPAPQDCKQPQSKKQEQPQDKTGGPNRH